MEKGSEKAHGKINRSGAGNIARDWPTSEGRIGESCLRMNQIFIVIVE